MKTKILLLIFIFTIFGCAHKKPLSKRFLASVDEEIHQVDFTNIMRQMFDGNMSSTEFHVAELAYANCATNMGITASSEIYQLPCVMQAMLQISYLKVAPENYMNIRRGEFLPSVNRVFRQKIFEFQTVCFKARSIIPAVSSPFLNQDNGMVVLGDTNIVGDDIAFAINGLGDCEVSVKFRIRAFLQALDNLNIRDRSVATRRATRLLDRYFPEPSSVATVATTGGTGPEISDVEAQRRNNCIFAETQEDIDRYCNGTAAPEAEASAPAEAAAAAPQVVAAPLNTDIVIYFERSEPELYRELSDCNRCNGQRKLEIIHNHYERNLTAQVATRFDPTSVEANDILRPLSVARTMAHSQVARIANWEILAKIKSLYLISAMDVFTNMGAKIIQQYTPIIEGAARDNNIRDLKICHNTIYRDIILRSSHSQSVNVATHVDSAFSSHYGSMSLLEVLPNFQALNQERILASNSIANAVRTVSENAVLNTRWIINRGVSCYEATSDRVMSRFVEYAMSQFPAPTRQVVTSGGERYEDVLRYVLDVELLELMLGLANSGGGVTEQSRRPMDQTTVNNAMAFYSLGQIVSRVGNFLRDGFVYAPNEMKTSLLTLKSRFKRALQYLIDHPRENTVENLERFFSEESVVKDIVMAISSDYTYRLTRAMISELRGKIYINFRARLNYRDDLTSAERVELLRINSLQTIVNNNARNMVRANDFRRIIRPMSGQGREYIQYVARQYVIPTILGRTISEGTEREIRRKLGNIVMHDNAEGGLIGKIVDLVAGHSLKGIYRETNFLEVFFFYDDGDFDWRILRQTTKGAEAVNYFTWRIIHPMMFENGLDITTYNQRMNYFVTILEAAQEAHD